MLLPPVSLPDLLVAAFDEIYRYPLRETARDTLNRQLRSGIDHVNHLAQLVINLRAEDRLCLVQDESEQHQHAVLLFTRLV